jgi:hypothetical protein
VNGLQHAKRLVKIVIGFTVLAGGVAMLVLPGPGILTIMAGLAILGAEFLWARRLLDKMKNTARDARDAVMRK